MEDIRDWSDGVPVPFIGQDFLFLRRQPNIGTRDRHVLID